MRCHVEQVTGVLLVSGNPGGVCHFREGVVVAVDSPGAPGVEAILLRSGRVSEDDWTAALRTESGQAGLVARGLVGAAALQVAAMMVVLDSAFAIAVGAVDGCSVEDGATAAPLSLVDGLAPADLVRETARRLAALSSLPFSPYRERFLPVGEVSLPAGWREIADQANGRRSARDIAFAVGRGIYPVTVEVARMVGAGVLEVVAAPAAVATGELEALRPRKRPDSTEAQAPSRLFSRRRTERKHIGL